MSLSAANHIIICTIGNHTISDVVDHVSPSFTIANLDTIRISPSPSPSPMYITAKDTPPLNCCTTFYHTFFLIFFLI